MMMKRNCTRQWYCVVAVISLLVSTSFGVAAKQTSVLHPIGTDLNSWNMRGYRGASKWTIGKAKINPEMPKRLKVAAPDGQSPELINAAKGRTDIFTEAVFGDCTIELEVMVPKGSNSGIYLMGRYEIQIKDSYSSGRTAGSKDMGAICGFKAPDKNAAAEPGAWQKFVIVFKAPRFQKKKRIQPAEFIKVILNGQVIHEHVKMTKGASSGALKKKEVPKGPLMFQGGLGPVAFRNIKITHEKEQM